MNNNGLEALCRAGNYWVVNWNLVQYTENYEAAILLAYLASMQSLYGNENGVFYRTVADTKRDTLLDARRQRRAINTLKNMGLIEFQILGLPKKRYFKVNAEKVAEVLFRLSCYD